MIAANSDIKLLPLENLSLTIFVVSLVCLTFSVLTLGLRIYVRLHERAFSLEDGLMTLGVLVYVADASLACFAARVGVGTRDDKLDAYFTSQGLRYDLYLAFTYLIALVIIKSSVCVTLLRITASQKYYRITVWAILALTIISFLVSFLGFLLFCSPVQALWDPSIVASGKGACAPVSVMVALSYWSTSSTILTDLACAVLPGVLLWNTHMKLGAKLSVYAMLSFGSIASISTMIRTPYITHIGSKDILYYHGGVVLYSRIELGIGCVAGSLPALRRLVIKMRNRPNSSSSSDDANKPRPNHTFGNGPTHGIRGRVFRNSTDTGFSFATVHADGSDDWRQLGNGHGNGEVRINQEKESGICVDSAYGAGLLGSMRDSKSDASVDTCEV